LYKKPQLVHSQRSQVSNSLEDTHYVYVDDTHLIDNTRTVQASLLRHESEVPIGAEKLSRL
jgi:hypothetical protein